MDVLAKRRSTYLTIYEEGIIDALFNGEMNENSTSSAYYKRGFDFGLKVRDRLEAPKQ
tara:strand:+ start:923 stop:1096 length:174 start_codon:yes stop_codon:yes gene_type:complete